MAGLDQKSPNVLLQSLCCRIMGKSEVDVAHQFQYAVRVVGSNYAPTIERDEFLVAEKIKKEPASVAYTLLIMVQTVGQTNVSVGIAISKSLRDITSRLAELGWLHNKVRKYTDQRSLDRAFGLVGQSFCAALHQELKEYYRLLSVLHSQLQVEDDQGVNLGVENSLTLRRLLVWTYDPKIRLKTLAALVDHCQGRKGGELSSAVHAYSKTGDPYMRALVQHILSLVSHPILNFLYRWIYDGELEDTYHEFFVASDPTVKTDRLWHDKYTLRKSMIPSFIAMDQARKVLLIGKSINFLHQVCHDRTPPGKIIAVSKSADSPKDAAKLFTDLEGAFQSNIDAAYFETSKYLLDVLNKNYHLLEHMQAMRRYLLLGQGDFIRHLMDLLKPELVRPATTLYQHNLTGILETAVRATNAQFDSPEILKRLDVRLLEVSPGDTGWDVFSMDYHVDGPIATVFTRECMSHYLRVFNFLWRAKRMEYILTDIWKGQMCNAKLLKSMPELSGVLHQCHILASEMVHFIHQMQYYITFEVLECSWDELWNKVQQAQDLDHIIAAHEVFLDTIISRCLLDTNSRPAEGAVVRGLDTADSKPGPRGLPTQVSQSVHLPVLKNNNEDRRQKKKVFSTKEETWNVEPKVPCR
ncbi:UNVERIFIED_CONTAM: hypothetical protein FKN15_043947 [Acipenser sinensis]